MHQFTLRQTILHGISFSFTAADIHTIGSDSGPVAESSGAVPFTDVNCWPMAAS